MGGQLLPADSMAILAWLDAACVWAVCGKSTLCSGYPPDVCRFRGLEAEQLPRTDEPPKEECLRRCLGTRDMDDSRSNNPGQLPRWAILLSVNDWRTSGLKVSAGGKRGVLRS